MFIKRFKNQEKLCIYKKGRNKQETKNNIKKKIIDNRTVAIYGTTGSGKSVFLNVLVNELHEHGYTPIYVTEKTGDYLANAFCMFKPEKKYHINGLKAQNQDVKLKDVKIYEYFTFNFPHKKKLYPINLIATTLKHIDMLGFKTIIPTESNKTIEICMDVADNMKPHESIFDFIWKVYESIELSELKNKSYSAEDMFLPDESIGEKRTWKGIKLGFKPFRKDFFIHPENSPYVHDFVKMCNDNKHFHFLTLQHIKHEKLKIFALISFLTGIKNALDSDKVNKPVMIILEEMKDLLPKYKSQRSIMFFLELLMNMLQRLRTKAYVISTSQDYLGIDSSFRRLFNTNFLGMISKDDQEYLQNKHYFKVDDMSKLKDLKVGEFVWWQSQEFGFDNVSRKIYIDLPPFANHEEQSESFKVKFKKNYADRLVTHVQANAEIKKLFDDAIERRKQEVKLHLKKEKIKKDSEKLKKEGKTKKKNMKIKQYKKERKLMIMKMCYDVEQNYPDLSLRKKNEKVKEVKDKMTFKKYANRYKKMLENGEIDTATT